MAARRALISTDDLRRMAKVAAEYGVSVNGRVDPLGNFSIRIVPAHPGERIGHGDDLDDRLAEFGAR